MNLKKKVGVLLLIGSSILLNTQCVSLTKSIINNSSKGQALIELFEKNYKGDKNYEPRINIVKSIYENKEEVLFIIPGFASNPNKLGSINDPNSVLGIASKYFKGDILIADYVSKDKTLEISEKLFVNLEKTIEDLGGNKDVYVLAISNGGNIFRGMLRKNPDLFKRVSFVASPLEGINFGIYKNFVLNNYPSLLGFEKEELGDNVDELFSGSFLFKELNSPSEEIKTEYIFNSFYSFFNDSFFIKGLDDSVVSRDSSTAYNVRKNNQFENVKILGNYLIKDNTHSSWWEDIEAINFILSTLKNGEANLEENKLEKKVKIL